MLEHENLTRLQWKYDSTLSFCLRYCYLLLHCQVNPVHQNTHHMFCKLSSRNFASQFVSCVVILPNFQRDVQQVFQFPTKFSSKEDKRFIKMFCYHHKLEEFVKFSFDKGSHSVCANILGQVKIFHPLFTEIHSFQVFVSFLQPFNKISSSVLALFLSFPVMKVGRKLSKWVPNWGCENHTIKHGLVHLGIIVENVFHQLKQMHSAQHQQTLQLQRWSYSRTVEGLKEPRGPKATRAFVNTHSSQKERSRRWRHFSNISRWTPILNFRTRSSPKTSQEVPHVMLWLSSHFFWGSLGLLDSLSYTCTTHSRTGTCLPCWNLCRPPVVSGTCEWVSLGQRKSELSRHVSGQICNLATIVWVTISTLNGHGESQMPLFADKTKRQKYLAFSWVESSRDGYL